MVHQVNQNMCRLYISKYELIYNKFTNLITKLSFKKAKTNKKQAIMPYFPIVGE